MKINRKQTNKRFVLTTLLLGAMLVIPLVLYLFWNGRSAENSVENDQSFISTEKSETEKQREEELKEDPSQKTQNNQSDTPAQPMIDESSGKNIVNVVLTGADIYNGKAEARGFVSNSIESEGVCTYTFTKDGQIISKQSGPLPNSTSTTCSTVSFNSNELSSGIWLVSLEYLSAASYGKSEPKELLVP